MATAQGLAAAEAVDDAADRGDPRVVLDMLRHTGAELARAHAEMDLMVHAVAHDLREPLRMVNAQAQMLARRYGGQLDADADQILASMADGAQRMQTLTEDLVDYASIRRRPLERTLCDSGMALDRALVRLAPLIEEARAIIHCDPMPVVMADAPALERLLLDLLDNAVRYRAPDRRPEIVIVGSEVEGGWHFRVTDNGVSVPPGECDRIFMVFQRLHGSEKPGTGLGLSICKRIVERHGGRIWAEPHPGQGTSFHFTLLRVL